MNFTFKSYGVMVHLKVKTLGPAGKTLRWAQKVRHSSVYWADFGQAWKNKTAKKQEMSQV